MKKLSLLSFTLFSCMIVNTVTAAEVAKGQKWYTKECKDCHGDGGKGASMHTQDEWNELFGKNGAMIIKKHKETKAKPYFEGDDFQEHSKSIRDFLFEYGSDSGNVPAC